ncbi:MAG: CRISPR system precrRNA processing endoribonuclease RAMP protein Cas6, partial [Syntrophorhabdales bacterium]
METGAVRVRATELKQGVLMPLIADLVEKGEATLASSADRDVRTITYDDLLDGANPFSRVATVQYASPTIVRVLGQDVPFPVIPEAFALYRQTWNIFSGLTLPHIVIEAMQHVRVTDFKVSSAASPFGAGVEGWVTMEMEKGRPEREIAVFNALVDFAFYCGTGAHTAEGLG